MPTYPSIYESTLSTIGENITRLRKELEMTQDELATIANIDRTYIGPIENAKQNISISVLCKIAEALHTSPFDLLFKKETEDIDDIAKFNRIFPPVIEYQNLATQYGINDIFQDNGGKLLALLLITGLNNLPGREGNDASDESGNEYEIKSVNLNLVKSFSTHHHLNSVILGKYRKAIWIFAMFRDIQVKSVYLMTPDKLETIFKKWEDKYNETGKEANNPKIPVKYVMEHGTLIFTAPPDGTISLATLEF